MSRLLIVEDEIHIASGLRFNLEADGHEVTLTDNGEAALKTLATHADAIDLVVLDVMLPGTDGLELCRWIRGRSSVPVILLTARGDEADRIVGLDLGADDYVTKPFSPRELISRVRAVLRRADAPTAPSERIVFGDLQLDAEKREVSRSGRELRLTAREFDLLWFLATHPRKVFSRDELMRRLWGYEAAFDTGTVTVHIRRLREKIEVRPSEPRFLQTVWGVGYRFVP
jgi:DNA-binding response OmpR family regulator